MDAPSEPSRRTAARAAGVALASSRLLVWGVGIATAAIASTTAPAKLVLTELTQPFGELGNTLVAPAARWDAVWYVTVAQDGYGSEGTRAFFPLYPLLVRAVSEIGPSPLIAGALISLAAMFAALYLLHRLTSLELGERVADQAVLLTAFAPLAVYLSAVYTESLFLALSVGAFYSARRGSFAWAGVLGGLAAATRSAGVLLLIPLALLYFYGPRTDRPPGEARGLRPRYPPRPDALWLLAVPAGVVAFAAYLALAHGDALGMFEGQHLANRHFALPPIGLGDGIVQGIEDAVRAVRVQGVGFSHNSEQLPWVAFAAVATVGALRRLPAAYGAWALCALALPLSAPLQGAPLTSFGRYTLVVFPLWMWLALWSVQRRRERLVLAVSAVLLAWYTWRFVSWDFVG
jgi:hypothetical protein